VHEQRQAAVHDVQVFVFVVAILLFSSLTICFLRKILRSEAEKARTCIVKLEQESDEFKQQAMKVVLEMKGPGKGRPMSLSFEHHVRTILASGCSARAAVEQVLSSARVFLPPPAFAEYERHVPTKRW
jgi:hypothetical protein